MKDFSPLFRWFSTPAEDRDPDFGHEVKAELVDLWGSIRDLLGSEQFDRVLGSVRPGKMLTRSEGAWVQTNAEQDSGFVNMTLEVDASELSLNVVGWFDPQLEKMENWLRQRAAWQFLREKPDWMLVIFVRHAHVGADGRAVFQGAPGAERERIHLSSTYPASLTTRLTGLRPLLDPQQEKLGLHIRRAWSPAEVAAAGDLVPAMTSEVGSWLEPIEAMRLA